MTKTNVLVVGNDSGVQSMFRKRGFNILYEIIDSKKQDPDLVCFTGGSDINPSLYGESVGFRTKIDPKRDVREGLIFERWLNKPKVGICRGGQLLNVLSGGAMWQHVNNHTDAHQAIDLLFTKKPLWVTSTHHQMMIPGAESFMLAMTPAISTEYFSGKKRDTPKYEPEVLWYPKTNSLCFQPHPEYDSKQGNEHTEYFFKLVEWAFEFSKKKE